MLGPEHRRPLRLSLLLTALAFACACDMFSVRDSEPPDDSPWEDVLNFADILDGTTESFEHLDYSDLFTDSARYRQGTGVVKERRELTQRLRDIETQFPSIAVEWQRNPGSEPLFSRQDTVELDSATYHVYISGDRGRTPDYSGHSDIGLIHIGHWAICYWYDFPEITDDAGHSFFNPDFTPSTSQ